MCVYVCVYEHVCAYMCACVYIYTCTHVYTLYIYIYAVVHIIFTDLTKEVILTLTASR